MSTFQEKGSLFRKKNVKYILQGFIENSLFKNSRG